MTPELQTITDDVIQAIVPMAVTFLVGLISAYLIKLFPALSGVLTATRIAQAEEATSNAVVAQAEKIAAGQTTVAEAAQATYQTLSSSALAALKAQGTTQEQFVARVTGNATAKLASPGLGLTPAPAAAQPASPAP